jgi:putative FmdB family regulatory protein
VPIYEYECRNCKAKFEKLVRSMAGKQKVACPSCGSAKVERAMSVFAAQSQSSPAGGIPEMCQRCGGDGPCPMK